MEAAAVVSRACGASSAHVVEHPVLLLHRYDTTNAYHNLEDVAAVFVALALLDSPAVKKMGVQVGLGWAGIGASGKAADKNNEWLTKAMCGHVVLMLTLLLMLVLLMLLLLWIVAVCFALVVAIAVRFCSFLLGFPLGIYLFSFL